MYLNVIDQMGFEGYFRLTLTIDVFKFLKGLFISFSLKWLTLTLDVFKYSCLLGFTVINND